MNGFDKMKSLICDIMEQIAELFEEGGIAAQKLQILCQEYLKGDTEVLAQIVERLGQSSSPDAEEFRTRIKKLNDNLTGDLKTTSKSGMLIPDANSAAAHVTGRGVNKMSNVSTPKMAAVTKLHPHPLIADLLQINDNTQKSLAISISEDGYLEAHPIIVIPGPSNQYLVIDGLTRLKAIHTAGLKEVPIIVMNFSSEAEMWDFVWRQQCLRRSNSPKVLIPAIEHFTLREAELAKKRQGSRSDLTSESNDSDVCGRANEFIARRIGISSASVIRLKRIINDPERKELFMAGKLNLTEALCQVRNEAATKSSNCGSKVVRYSVPEKLLQRLVRGYDQTRHGELTDVIAHCPAKTRRYIVSLGYQTEHTVAEDDQLS